MYHQPTGPVGRNITVVRRDTDGCPFALDLWLTELKKVRQTVKVYTGVFVCSIGRENSLGCVKLLTIHARVWISVSARGSGRQSK